MENVQREPQHTEPRHTAYQARFSRTAFNHRNGTMHKHGFLKEIFFILSMLVILIFVAGYELKLLKTQLLIRDILKNGVNYEAFRELRVSENSIKEARSEIKHLLKKEPQLKKLLFMDEYGYFTFSMLARDFDLLEYRTVDEKTFCRGIGRIAATRGFQELYFYYKAILADLKFFPVPKVDNAEVTYGDSWYGVRNYGGPRKHEGTDLMASNNLPGFFPVVSITDGFVEKMGWLEQGGYRIGIRSEAGGYFYYAHFAAYAPELETGDRVIAGQVLGFMGDSGYGPEGTTGQFDVHLHLGVYVSSDVLGTGEMSVNPYCLLKILEKNRTSYSPYIR